MPFLYFSFSQNVSMGEGCTQSPSPYNLQILKKKKSIYLLINLLTILSFPYWHIDTISNRCEDPTDGLGKHGISTYTGLAPGSVAEHSCKSRKRRIYGSEKQICLACGVWSGDSPECLKAKAAYRKAQEAAHRRENGVFTVDPEDYFWKGFKWR